MDVKKTYDEVVAWREQAMREIEGLKVRLVEQEKQIVRELNAAHSVHADLGSITKAAHVLVGVGELWGWPGSDKHEITVELDRGRGRIEMGRIKLAEDVQNNRDQHGRYRAVLMLFREEEK